MGLHTLFAFVFLIFPFTLQAKMTCQTSACHQDLGKGAFIHGPMKSAKGCTVCHLTDGKSADGKHPGLLKMGPSEINKTCYLCHEEFKHQFQNSKSVHKVIAEKSCTSCHNPHQSEQKKLLVASGEMALCLKCHENKADFKNAKHHVIKDIKKGCLSCHDAHASKHDKLFKKDNTLGLCLECHKTDQISKDQSKILSISDWTQLPPALLHEPVRKGECQKCHEIHGSSKKSLLAKEYSAAIHANNGSLSAAELCFSCHKTDLVDKRQVLNETKFRNGEVNLHYLHMTGTNRKRNCSACHDPHGSETGSLIRGNFQYLNWQVPLIFKKNVGGGSCATACHKKMEYNREKAVINEKDP